MSAAREPPDKDRVLQIDVAPIYMIEAAYFDVKTGNPLAPSRVALKKAKPLTLAVT